MLDWQRNLVTILVSVAAVLASIASVVVIVDRVGSDGDSDDGRDARPRVTRVTRGIAPRERLAEAVAVQPPLLGVSVEMRDGALVVTRVAPGSPAANAGVKEGDAILRAAGMGVPDVRALREAIARVEPGSTYALQLRRDGREQTLQVERPRAVAQPQAPFGPGRPAQPRLQPGQPGQPGLQPARPVVPSGVPGLQPSRSVVPRGLLDDAALERLIDQLRQELERRRAMPRMPAAPVPPVPPRGGT